MPLFDLNDWLLLPAFLIGGASLLGLLAFRLRTGLASSDLGALLMGRWDRHRPGVALLGLLAVWLLADAIDLILPGEGASQWALRLAHLALLALGPTLVWAALAATERTPWLGSRLRVAGIAVPVLSAALLLSNQLQGWLWTPAGQRSFGALSALQLALGPWSAVQALYGLGCMAVAAALMARAYARVWPAHSHEALAFATALSAPALAQGIGVLAPDFAALPLGGLGLALATPLLFQTLRPDPFESLLTRMQGAIFDALGDAIALIDAERRVVYANLHAQTLLQKAAPAERWQPGRALAHYWPKLSEMLRDDTLRSGEISLMHDGHTWFYEIRVTEAPPTDRVRRARLVVLRDVTERRRAERTVRQLAFYDGLTGLANRHLFARQLAQAIAAAREHEHSLALLYLDLDHFKNVNDTLGHAAGDDLLRQVGDRLQQCLRPADTLARMGGDEFAALIEDAPEEDALVVAERVLDALRSPFTISDREIFSRASVGAVHAGGVANSADLLKHADVAMYVAKSQGKSRVVAYRGEMEEALLDELALENDMQRALERQEFAVQYQPVVGVSDQELSGFEALLRWHHPTRGVIEPESFIYIAERTGMIIPIGEWVLGEACRTLARLQEHHPQEPPLTMAINVSAKQLSQADFRDVVERALKDAGVPANTVILEITESTMMADGTRTIAYLEALHNLGVRLAVDDFGTGYSSLSYLRKFPLDELKVDKSFIDDLVDSGKEEHVVQSIIGLAKALHLKIVAEGVENNEQLAILRAFDCDEAQGFLFSTPVDIDDAERLLTEGAMDGRAAA